MQVNCLSGVELPYHFGQILLLANMLSGCGLFEHQQNKTLQSITGAGETISFKDQDFFVKSGVQLGPGPNDFIAPEKLLNSTGELNLQLRPTAIGGAYASEVYSAMAYGHGEYSWTVEGDFKNFSSHTVFGVFLYDYDDEHEIDVIEISKWGKVGECYVQSALHQANNGDCEIKRNILPAVVNQLTCKLVWQKTFATSECWWGGVQIGKPDISHTFQRAELPHPKIARVHMNLWSFNGAPFNNRQADIVKISNFSFSRWTGQ